MSRHPIDLGGFVRCSCCKIFKPRLDFQGDRSNRRGLQSACAECVCKQRKRRYANARTVVCRRDYLYSTSMLWNELNW